MRLKRHIRKRLLEQVHTCLSVKNGSAHIFVIIIVFLGIITSLYTLDVEFERAKAQKFEIKEQLKMALEGAARRIDFYQASEGNIVIESDFQYQFEEYIKEALLLDDTLTPFNEKDYGIAGQLVIQSLNIVPSGYDSVTDYTFHDTGLVAIMNIPMNIHVLGLDFSKNVTIKVFTETRD